MSPAVVGFIAAASLSQAPAPFQKSDLIRLLATSLPATEIADLVQRRCVSFTPSERDKADLRAAGAGELLLGRLDECARRIAKPTAAPARTGFVSGTGQRGRVGSRLPLPLVFEARDTLNRPVPGQAVRLVGSNARVERAAAVTDSAGRIIAVVILGERAGPAHIVATLGGIERQGSLVAQAGPPATLVLRCGAADITARLALGVGPGHALVVRVLDHFGNEASVSDLRVTASDHRTVRASATDHAIVLDALRPGTANVVVEASGVRRTIATVVGPTEGSTADCRRGVPRG
jgi:hypothetical protein